MRAWMAMLTAVAGWSALGSAQQAPPRMGSRSGRLRVVPGQTLFEQPVREWWAQLRNAAGRVGWTDEPHKFTQGRAG